MMALAVGSTHAFAQVVPSQSVSAAAEPQGQADTETIVVTGSRIARSGFTAPTPVTVVGQERLQVRGITNVGEALNELPSFRALQTPATQQAQGGNIGARILDLRGLGATRTLVLVDGKRFVPSTTQGTIDVNLIPSALVERTEVVTGGASAAYGSDAVAGVVNFILNKRLDGLRASAQYGITERGDNAQKNVTLAYGTGFGDDRGHFVIGGEWDKVDGLGDCYTRIDWCPGQLAGNSAAGAGGLPANVVAGPLGTGNLAQAGLINFGTTAANVRSFVPRGITFNPDGSTRAYQYGTILGNATTPLFTIGGEDAVPNAYLQGILLSPPVERIVGYGHLDYELSDGLTANLDLSYGKVEGTIVGSLARDANFVINRDNAFLPGALATIMDANGLASLSLGRAFGDLGGSINNSKNETYRAVVSLEGRINDNWRWDAYYQYGRNEFRQDYTGNVVIARMRNAIDAVNVGGSTVCRINADANTTNNDPSCVAFNPFGENRFTPDAAAYVAPSGFQETTTTQHVIAANLNGDLFALPGGDFSVAAGGEYRRDRAQGTADALSTANAFWSFNGKPINGRIEVTEGYVEAVAPLLRDVTGFNLLELNGAVRRTHYSRSSPGTGTGSTSVNVTTWKLGGIWEPLPELRFRVTRSRDIRAPNVSELFGPVTLGRVTINDPVFSGQQFQVDAFSGANPALAPEKADTWTAGVVLQPSWDFLRSFRFSADYFDIKVGGAIATLGSQSLITGCAGALSNFCQFITRDPTTNQITRVQDTLQNVSELVNRGIDFEATYRTDIGAAGSIDFRVLATHYLELEVAGIDRTGQTGFRPGTTTGIPDWTVDGTVTWTLDPITLSAHARHITRGKLDALLVGPEDDGYAVTLPNSASSNRVAARTYFDLSGTVRVAENFELFGVINNLFDKDPPLAPSAQGGTNQVYFDPYGRAYRIGVRVRM
jgi:outer membrane receptor protein involved in Fe transport